MRVISSLLVLCGLLFFVSCQETDKKRYSRLVNEWLGKEVMFPENSVFTIQGKDTVDFDFFDSEYKVVTYIDSAGCTSCKLQLPRWNEFIKEVKEQLGKQVSFLFYFHPKDLKELRILTLQNAFTYPVCLDEKDEFNALNNFPSDMTFQTFLLNKENKVVVVGNPTQNPKVKDLYLKALTGNNALSTKFPLTTVSIEEPIKDFGTFPMEQKQEYVFSLINTGNSLLVVYDVVASCGCTQVEYNKKPVRPGETLGLKVTYNADEAVRFRKSLKVYCNVENAPLQLTVTGMAQ